MIKFEQIVITNVSNGLICEVYGDPPYDITKTYYPDWNSLNKDLSEKVLTNQEV